MDVSSMAFQGWTSSVGVCPYGEGIHGVWGRGHVHLCPGWDRPCLEIHVEVHGEWGAHGVEIKIHCGVGTVLSWDGPLSGWRRGFLGNRVRAGGQGLGLGLVWALPALV
ncbi:hypothetical protein ILYODFUR_035331 [Ilyodon furcidens]|uniref:Uncharacterized protein n=1 Tax=Ilyodon furcidens TaxID=33524 RepID=A0ABV0V8S1_9TELE